MISSVLKLQPAMYAVLIINISWRKIMVNAVSHFQYRKNEESTGAYDRCGRFYCKKGSWFFKTREAIDYGPYQTRVECRYAYNEFIEVVSSPEIMTPNNSDYHDTQSDWQSPKISFN
jgi:hypothetical protein